MQTLELTNWGSDGIICIGRACTCWPGGGVGATMKLGALVGGCCMVACLKWNRC